MMMASSLRTRSATFAFVFGPPRFVQRQEASGIYDAVSDALQFDDLTFKYGTSEATHPGSKGFRITLERKEGRGKYSVVLGNPSIQEPIRLVMQYEWPPSPDHVDQLFDATSRAVFDTLEAPEGGWQRVLAEVRLRAQCSVQENDALSFMRKRFYRLSKSWIDSLGEPLAVATVKFEVNPSVTTGDDPLGGPKREFTIESLREDPRCLYLELMSQWQQVVRTSESAGTIDFGNVRSFHEEPSAYVTETIDFLRARLSDLDKAGRAKP